MDSPASFRTVTVTLKEVEVRDLIEFDRTAYAHWAVYVGEGFAIHMDHHSKNDKLAIIRKELVVNIAEKDLCRVNNLEKRAARKGLRARDAWQIVSTAESQLGDIREYRLFTDNCEYFATSCRNGKKDAFSGLVDTAVVGISVRVTAVLAGVAVGLLIFLRLLARR